MPRKSQSIPKEKTRNLFHWVQDSSDVMALLRELASRLTPGSVATFLLHTQEVGTWTYALSAIGYLRSCEYLAEIMSSPMPNTIWGGYAHLELKLVGELTTSKSRTLSWTKNGLKAIHSRPFVLVGVNKEKMSCFYEKPRKIGALKRSKPSSGSSQRNTSVPTAKRTQSARSASGKSKSRR